MKVGFIGLGIMGKPMAKNLLKAGHDVYVNDLNKDAVAELVAAGAHAGESNADVAKNVEVVITMVPNSPHMFLLPLQLNKFLAQTHFMFWWKICNQLFRILIRLITISFLTIFDISKHCLV